MDLSEQEKQVLMLLLDNSRINDSDIAEKIGITSQAVGLIRKKLEEKGVIKKYACILDYEKLGFNSFVVIKVKNINENNNIIESLISLPEIIFLCTVSGLNIFYGLYAFKNSDEKDKYLKTFQKQFKKHLEIIEIHSFSISNLLKLDSSQLFKMILEK